MKTCPCLHLGYREEWEYESTWNITPAIRRELDAALQYPSLICDCPKDEGPSVPAPGGVSVRPRCCHRRKIVRPTDGANFETYCPVCTEQLRPGNTVIFLKCRHVFCSRCVEKLVVEFLDYTEKQWFTTSSKCPLCKEEFLENGYEVVH